MKRFYALILVLMLGIFPAAAADVPELAGKEAVLYCAENGQVLLDKEMDTTAHPASITKLMTALLVFESGRDLSETVTVSYEAVHSIERDSTNIALDTGEEVTLEQMMYAMLLTSANDAANVLAEAVDGTQQAFAEHMTARAVELGCRHTHFMNAHGLDDPLHYTTAYDMAVITRALLEYDQFAEISGTRVYYMPPTNKQDEQREFWNKQNILNPQSKFYDATAIAGKNGYTTQAGHTLVTVARRDGVTLIAVTMGTTESKYDKHRDTVAMFAYGYDNFTKTELSAADITAEAERAGLSPDADAVEPAMVLLPAGNTADDLVWSAQYGTLRAACGGQELLAIEVPIQTVSAAALTEEAPRTVPEPTESPAKKGGIPKVLWYAGGVLLVLLLAFLGFLSYRTARIRRQRRMIRERRMRARRERQRFDE
ncbi:MAG: D-alanyl-D-alanine carboxypeptidase family protein [Butyricicoccus sp.]